MGVSDGVRFEAVYHNPCSQCGAKPHSTVELVEIFTDDHSLAVSTAASLNAMVEENAAFAMFKKDLAEFGAGGLGLGSQERRLKFYELLGGHGLLPGTSMGSALSTTT